MKTVISLCDITGAMVDPWSVAGFTTVQVDPQHARTVASGARQVWSTTVEECLEDLLSLDDVAFVAAFPPCTDLTRSGARWWPAKAAKDPLFQDKAMALVKLCAHVGETSGAPWMLENPMGAITRLWRKWDHKFHPWQYSGLCPDDNYTKETGLWVGGGFTMPEPVVALHLGAPCKKRIHWAAPKDRRNVRSKTPKGFAEAVFLANR